MDITSLEADIDFFSSSAKTKAKWLTKLILIDIIEINLQLIGV